MPACCSWNDVFQYETNKVTRIQSVNYGTIKWILHMTVFSYVSFALMSDKLYQRKEPLISSVHTKVKGVAEVTENVTEGGVTKLVHGIFDTADYTLPLQGNSFFVMTNYLKSEGQEQKLCPEYPSRGKQCHSDQGCIKGWMDPQSKGIQTGRCIPYDQKRKTCEIFAWCPAEEGKEAPRPALLRSAENFTVLIKNNIDFPGHNYTTRNILPGMNISCTFHKTWNPQCPIFRLGDIFQEIGENFTEVAVQGGIMGIEIYWDCNLDSWSHRCQPKYSFRRLDDKYTNESLFPGYNFRYAKYYKENGMEKRTLIKAFGVRFDILVFGTGGKFDIIQLVVYIGSTLSYFGLTLKYVSFVDEPHIWMVDQQLLGKSLQDVKGQEVPRPQTDFLELSRLSLSLHHSPPIPGQPEEMQLLQIEAVPRSRDSPDWCQCGNCLPSQLPENRRALEELCCRRKPGQCITTSELFSKIVLSREALQLLLLYQEPLLALEGEAINSKLRHCAYRSYATWRFVSQDMADFAILPSCCRWKIRKEFPKTQGQYSGFKYPY
ncbi:purinergic receptor P2X, ligand-gated ion channel, 7, isoform CRA_b [Rattus norvegicus]|uniref:P2X purinoceptor n=1 Tax=Rattus norvegicus TaxID=10116 RepID=A6J184_RAT|nr:purinergic receptor P2X, ligand-gated ion channel, 7, isoform CRA_b [Rattus norvegicus]